MYQDVDFDRIQEDEEEFIKLDPNLEHAIEENAFHPDDGESVVQRTILGRKEDFLKIHYTRAGLPRKSRVLRMTKKGKSLNWN